METALKQAFKKRRTYYSISNSSTISDNEIEDIINSAITDIPSAFNSQTTRIVLLLGEHHKKLWSILKDILRNKIPEAEYKKSEKKIDESFASGYGTILFLEETEITKNLQEQFPLYSEKFPVWSEHTSAMHQLAIWTMLEAAGLGASLQHYNPIIDNQVAKQWNLPKSWKLIAQMPFGTPTQDPAAKQYNPINERVKIFK